MTANLADYPGHQTGIVTAMVDCPMGELITKRAKVKGIKPVHQRFTRNGVTGSNVAAIYKDHGHEVGASVVFYGR